MDWRQPPDHFAWQLDAAREAVRANTTDPWHAVEPFEPILEELNEVLTAREEKLPRVRSLGRELFAELRSAGRPVAMEVRHYCWHLQHLGDPNGSPASSLKDMLMVTVTRFAHYEGHAAGRCFICAEFPEDLPFQGSPHGRAHFDEWLKRKYGEDDA
jgi:hypothetical protein